MVGAKALVFWRQNSNPSLIQYKDLHVYIYDSDGDAGAL
jgi:hypothetical protein